MLLAFIKELCYDAEVTRRCVGMADDADSKSVGGNTVWVQVPPPAEKTLSLDKCLKKCYKKFLPAFSAEFHERKIIEIQDG